MHRNIWFALFALSVVLSAPLDRPFTNTRGSSLGHGLKQRQSHQEQRRSPQDDTDTTTFDSPSDTTGYDTTGDGTTGDGTTTFDTTGYDTTGDGTTGDGTTTFDTTGYDTTGYDTTGDGTTDSSSTIAQLPPVAAYPTGGSLYVQIARKFPDVYPTWEELVEFVESLGTPVTEIFEIKEALAGLWGIADLVQLFGFPNDESSY